MVVDCSREILNCISRYRETLAENKNGITQIYDHPNDPINVKDYLYKGDKICNEEILQEGQDCYGTTHGRAKSDYSEWKQKIESSHGKDLVNNLGDEIKSPFIQDNIKEKISSGFEHNKQLAQDVRTDLISKIIEPGLNRSEANEKIEETARVTLSQQETDEQVVFWDIISNLYQEKDPAPDRGHFDESRLECYERECLDAIVNKKLEDLECEKQHFLDNTENIFKHIRDDSIDNEVPSLYEALGVAYDSLSTLSIL